MNLEAARNPLVLELHPLCTLFPRLEGAEFEALKADIIQNGQLEPITVHEGQVLEGGNRFRACIEAGIKPILKDFTGANPVAFVLSANLHRRHLTPGQQAAIVASAQDWTLAQTVGNPAFKTAAQYGNVAGLETVAARVAQSGASERTQRMADKVAKASPDLAKRVAYGEISLPKALEQLVPRASAPLVHENLDAPSFDAPEPAPPAAAAAKEPAASNEEGLGEATMPTPLELLVVAQAKVDQLEKERDELRARVAMLESGDLAAQLVAVERDRDGVRNRAADHYKRWSEANNKVIGYQRLIDRLRKLTGISKDGDLVEWVRTAARSAA